MKGSVYQLSLLLLVVLLGCGTNADKTKVLKGDEYINSFLRDTDKLTVAALDSALNTNLKDSDKALLFFEKGKLYSKIQNHETSIEYFEKALPLFLKIEEKEFLAETYWYLGSNNAYMSNVEEATSNLLIALDYSIELKNKQLEANIYSSLAHTYYVYQDFDKAVFYTKEAISIQKKEQDTIGLSATFNNIAVIYKNIGDFKNAFYYNNKSLELNLIFKDSNAIAKSYNNLGLVSEELNQLKNAEKYFLDAIELNKRKGQLNSSPLRNLGALYLRLDSLSKAKEYYTKALEIEEKTKNIKIQKDISNVLLHIALQKKNFNNAIYYQAKRDSLAEIHAKKETQEKLKMLEDKYKLVAKEKALYQEKNINKKNKIIFITLVILLVFIGLISYQLTRNKKLKAEKERINLEQKVLRSQMNPHFIFNALSSIQNTLLDNDPIKSATYLSMFAKLIRQNFDFINEKKILLIEEIDALRNYLRIQKLRFNDKFEYEINVSPYVDIELEEIPPLLIQPFVENAIEHGFKNKKKKGILIVNITKTNQSICYEIKDNGRGYNSLKKDNKVHSIDIFKKRLKLFGRNEEKTLVINSDSNGTTIKFCLKI